MNDYAELVEWLHRIELNLDDAQKRKLMQRIATKLKRSMTQRIRAQQNPDGGHFVPRKCDHQRAIRRGAMFQRLPRMIKTAYSSTHAEVGFSGRTARVMSVHQYGLTAQPSPKTRAVNYPVRETVGFSPADEQIIISEIRNFLAQG